MRSLRTLESPRDDRQEALTASDTSGAEARSGAMV